jgi:hypothetical protein
MIVKILGIIDGLCALAFVLAQFFFMQPVLYVIAAYLIVKGILFAIMAQDVASIVDIISLAFVTTMAALYLAQKCFFSLIRLS